MAEKNWEKFQTRFCDQADMAINNIIDIIEYFKYSNSFNNKNKLLVDYTFYRCVMTNISSLVFLLLQIYSFGFTKNFVGLFDGFTLVAFNFMWIIVPIIKYHMCIEKDDTPKKGYKLSEILYWIVVGIRDGIALNLIWYLLVNDLIYFKYYICFLVILYLNVTYGKLTNFNWSIIIGPLLYLIYWFIMASEW